MISPKYCNKKVVANLMIVDLQLMEMKIWSKLFEICQNNVDTN